jgi:hypothetical protein
VLIQDVLGLKAGTRYRLRARVRADHLGPGAATLAVHSRSNPDSKLAGFIVRTSDWTIIDRRLTLEPERDPSLVIVVGLTADAAPGAVVWCDDIMLVEDEPPS